MDKFINAADALKRTKKALHVAGEDVIEALEEACFNERVTADADAGYTYTCIKFKYPTDQKDTSKYFSAIKEYIKNLGYEVAFLETVRESDGNLYYYYYIYWEE